MGRLKFSEATNFVANWEPRRILREVAEKGCSSWREAFGRRRRGRLWKTGRVRLLLVADKPGFLAFLTQARTWSWSWWPVSRTLQLLYPSTTSCWSPDSPQIDTFNPLKLLVNQWRDNSFTTMKKVFGAKVGFGKEKGGKEKAGGAIGSRWSKNDQSFCFHIALLTNAQLLSCQKSQIFKVSEIYVEKNTWFFGVIYGEGLATEFCNWQGLYLKSIYRKHWYPVALLGISLSNFTLRNWTIRV